MKLIHDVIKSFHIAIAERTPEQIAEAAYRRARQAAAKGPLCPECKGQGVLLKPNPYGEYIKSQGGFSVIPCPTCSWPARKRWYIEHCGLKGKELHYEIEGSWMGGDWSDLPPAEAKTRVQERRQAKQAIIDASQPKASGFFTFWGDFGSGKSRALATVVNQAIESGREAYYVPLPTLLEHLRHLVASGRDSSSYWERVLAVPVLCVDEVTRFSETAWTRQQVFVLADTRYRLRDCAVTCFATNADPRQNLPPDEDVGYLYSRMREGTLLELRGDMRPAVSWCQD